MRYELHLLDIRVLLAQNKLAVVGGQVDRDPQIGYHFQDNRIQSRVHLGISQLLQYRWHMGLYICDVLGITAMRDQKVKALVGAQIIPVDNNVKVRHRLNHLANLVVENNPVQAMIIDHIVYWHRMPFEFFVLKTEPRGSH